MNTKPTVVNIAEIRAAIARCDTTQEHVAEQAGISRTAFYRRMNRRVDFSANELAAVAKALGVPMYDFIAEDVAA